MNWWCRFGFHDWYHFRLVEEADCWGFPVWDQVCLRCGKLRLDGTEGHAEFTRRAEEHKLWKAERKAKAEELLRGRI